MRRVVQILVILALALGILGVACATRAPATPDRPEAWAEPMPGKPGLPNLFRVDEGIYRGAQPDAAGMAELERLGVRTVISLRGFHDDDDEVKGTGLTTRSIRFNTWHPEDEDVVAFLRIMGNPANRPVFFHCQHGSDRTGTMCAIYRMAFQGWSRDDAIREMTEGGFGFHTMWDNLIRYLRALDLERLKREAGLS